MLKIDVEDVEEQVIDGGLKTIEKHKPIIIIERHSPAQLQSAMSRLAPLGYKVKQNWQGIHTYSLEC